MKFEKKFETKFWHISSCEGVLGLVLSGKAKHPPFIFFRSERCRIQHQGSSTKKRPVGAKETAAAKGGKEQTFLDFGQKSFGQRVRKRLPLFLFDTLFLYPKATLLECNLRLYTLIL